VKRGLTIFIVVCAFSLSASAQTGADDFLSAQQKELEKNPAGVVFKISLTDNRTQFQQGEIIRVELAFSSKSDKKYQLDGATYDRGGRLLIDAYHVDLADGATDPLKDQFDYDSLRIYGGLRSMPILDANPYTIVRDLNEYLRFDKPGKYRLYVVSHRIRKEKGTPFEGLPAASNIIEITIVPTDPEWAAKQFQSAIKILDAHDPLDFFSNGERSADRVISFLGTEDATRYMARHFDNQYDYILGLIGSPLRSTVVSEMEKGLEAPERSVSSWYLYVLSNCAYALNHPPNALDANAQGKAKIEPLPDDEALKKRADHFAVLKAYEKKLAIALPDKKGSAKSVSVLTMLKETRRWQKEIRSSLPAEALEKISADIVRLFFDFSPMEQESLLADQWAWIKRPGLMPLLERYYQTRLREKYRDNPSQFGGIAIATLDSPETNSKPAHKQMSDDTVNLTAAGIGLQRIFESDPARGRELIMKEIANPSGRVPYKALALLPDKTLPEMDDAFATAMEKPQPGNLELFFLQAQLLNRYGTAAVLPRIKAAFHGESRPASCNSLAPVISYFFRVDPAYGATALEQALSPSSPCYKSLLGSLAPLHYGPEIEALAIRRLDDPDLEAVADSAITLGEYGSAQAEAPLWKRFEKWHEEWKQKADQMQREKSGNKSDTALDRSFSHALAQATAWLADAEKLKRIQSLCLTNEVRENIGYYISLAEAPQKRLVLDNWPATANVVQYYLHEPLDNVKAKLAQFPKGTVFLLKPSLLYQGDADQEATLLKELKPFLAEHGMIIERPPMP
jgi:hypothetical protein